VAGTAPLGAEGRVCSSCWWGVTSQALPRGDQRVPRPGQVGARNSARGHPRRGAGGAGLAAGQLSAVARVLGKGKQGVLAHASGDRVACESARPGGLGRARCAILALAARVRERTAQGAQARREWVRPRTPSRRSPPFERAGQAEAQQGSEGRPIPAAPTAPRFRSWGPAHSPTGGAPISPTKRV
jgi:hypothetical protein